MNLPEIFSKGPPTAKQWKALGEYLQAQQIIPGIGMKIAKSTIGTRLSTYPKPLIAPPVFPPFWPRARVVDPDAVSKTFKIQCTGGCVTDRVTTDTTAATPQAVVAALAETSITDGQALYVSVAEAASGAMGTCAFYIGSASANSTHYAPPIEGDYGSTGTYRIKLAVFHGNTTTGEVSLDRYAAGSNIDYVRDLPIFGATGVTTGVARLFTKYDLAAGQYDYKGIKGVSPITVTEAGTAGSEVIEIGLDGDLPSGGTGQLWFSVTGYADVLALEWVDGLITTDGNWLYTVGGSAQTAFTEYTPP